MFCDIDKCARNFSAMYLKFSWKKAKYYWLLKYKFGKIKATKATKIWHLVFSTMNFPQIWRKFLNHWFCSIFFTFSRFATVFCHSVFKDYSVLVGHHTIFKCFLVKSDLYSLRRFNLRRSVKDPGCRTSKYI